MSVPGEFCYGQKSYFCRIMSLGSVNVTELPCWYSIVQIKCGFLCKRKRKYKCNELVSCIIFICSGWNNAASKTSQLEDSVWLPWRWRKPFAKAYTENVALLFHSCRVALIKCVKRRSINLSFLLLNQCFLVFISKLKGQHCIFFICTVIHLPLS